LNGQVDENLIVCMADGADAVKQVMQCRPDVTAIFAIHDLCGYSIMRGLRELGLEVPHDLSIVAMDGIQPVPDDYPALSVVTFPAFEVGYMAATLLYKQLAEQHLQYFHMVVRCQLIEKETCARPRSQVLHRV
jgi:DNA-binding LacI/PurR family transcriptional regulator